MPTTNLPDRRIDRWLVTIAVAGTAVVFWRGSQSVFATPKLTIAMLSAAGVVIVGVWRMLATATIRRPLSTPVHWAMIVFLAVAAIAVATSESTGRSMLGQRDRAGGFLLYLSCALLFVAATRSFDARSARKALTGVVAAGAIVALYALVQRAGLDPFAWSSVFAEGAAFSTFGNTNFVSGYVAAMVPLALALVYVADDQRVRIAAGVAAAGMALAVLATKSSQGLIATGAGLGVVVLVWAVTVLAPEARRRAVLAAAALAIVAFVVIGLGLSGSGPASRLNDAGFDYRQDYWRAALEMVKDEPVTGVGLDMWGGYYRAERSSEAAAAVTLKQVTDEPHSVPLWMLASGGIPLGLAYAAFVGLTGWVLLRGLRRSEGADRLLLAGVGGSWLAYHVQSLVSIDLPASVVLHFTLAAMIVALSLQQEERTIAIPFLMATTSGPARPGRPARRRRERFGGAIATWTAVVLAVLALWQLSRPLRADLGIKHALDLRASDPGEELRQLHDAAKLVRWEPEYWSLIGEEYARFGQGEVALVAFKRAIGLDPRRFADVLNAARAATAVGDVDSALRYYERALRLEPNGTELKAELGGVLIKSGDFAGAMPYLEEATSAKPDEVDWHISLARALYGTGDTDAGTAQLETALELAHDNRKVRLEIAATARAAKQYDVAQSIVDELLAEAPGEPFALTAAGEILEVQGRTDEAIKLYELVLSGYHPEKYPAEAAGAQAGLRRLGVDFDPGPLTP